jgi:uncharacterized small protein (DUF1192 family)
MFGLALVELLVVLAVPVLVIGGIVVFAMRTLGLGGDKRVGSGMPVSELEQRTARLEEALEATQAQLDRLAEGQEFTNKLLSERLDK